MDEEFQAPDDSSFPGGLVSRSAKLASLFGYTDYFVFFFMLLVSAGIGVFYGFIAKKKGDSTKEFLMAGKSMSPFPIAMSLIASFMSAITLLGTPSEVYQHGAIYYLIGISYILVTPATAYLYLPVFWDMQVTSAYEYLEVRFHPCVRRLGSGIFIVQMTLYMAIVVYAPSLALAQVTGLNLYLSVFLICFVCMFYTTLGGMKAVLWTDTLQVGIMYVTVIFIAIYGTISVGGLGFVWEKAVDSGRAEWSNWDTSPTARHTVWSLVVGGFFTWITIYGVNQAQVQRYLCVKEISMARRALWMNMVGLCVLMLTVVYTGLIIYAKYFDCDPVRSGIVTAGDQLFPLFVMETMGQFPGLPGLFVAGIFSGALSTVSSGMNSLAAITLEDFVRGTCFPNISPQRATQLSKVLSLFYGLLTLALVFVAQMLGNILSAALSIFGIVGGPLLGMFTLGMFFPWANATGCFVGTIASLALMFFIGTGQQVARTYGFYVIEKKATSVAGCVAFANETLSSAASNMAAAAGEGLDEDSSIWNSDVFKISYIWYSALGCCTVIVVGLIVSFITGKQNVRTLNPRTLSPGFHAIKRFVPGTKGLGEDFVSYSQVGKASWDDHTLPSSILLETK